jgi:hypothetical protein
MKKINGKLYVKLGKDTNFTEMKPLEWLHETNVRWSFEEPCETGPFPEYKSITVPLKFISYAYICHWTRNELGEVQYYLPEFMNV